MSTRRRWLLSVWVLPVALAALGFGLRVWQPGPTTEVPDEDLWLQRTDAFRHAIEHGNFADATAAHQVPGVVDATMPGVTTMWAGNAGRVLARIGAAVGLNDPVVGPSAESATVLRLGRAVVALWCAISIGLLVALATPLVGRGAAAVTGVLLATEPWFVGNGDLLHTDALVTLFSAVSVMLVAWALRGGRATARGPTTRRVPLSAPAWPLIASGVFAALAALTKITAVGIVVPGAAITVVAMSLPEPGRHRWRPGPELLRRWVRLGLWWTGAAVVTFVVVWPGMWVAPLRQLGAIGDSLHQVGRPFPTHFLGRATTAPGPAFYPVTWAFRMTPWFLLSVVAVLLVLCVRLVRRVTRPRVPAGWVGEVPLWPLAVCVPYAVAITLGTRKMARYVLPLLPFVALVAGAVVAGLVGVLARRAARAVWPVGIAATLAIAALTLGHAPYATAYVNPLLGGQKVGRHAIKLSRGEGIERLGATIAERERGNCSAVTVANDYDLAIALPCGRFRMLPADGNLAGLDFVVTYIYRRQNHWSDRLWRSLHQHATLIDQVDIGGVSYAQLWRVDAAAST